MDWQPALMPPARLLALAICSYLNPFLRKPVRLQPYRGHSRHGWDTHSFASGRPAALQWSLSIQSSYFFGQQAAASCSRSAIVCMSSGGEDSTSAGSSASKYIEEMSPGLDSAADVFEYLRGSWDLRKNINYKVGGMAGSWDGTATFSPDSSITPSAATDSDKPEMVNNPEAERQRGSINQESSLSLPSSSQSPSPSLLLRYLEQGIFKIDGKGTGFEAGQRLVYDCSGGGVGSSVSNDSDDIEGAAVRVYFVDDPKKPNALRFFHELDFRKPMASEAEEDHDDRGGKRALTGTDEPENMAAATQGKTGCQARAEFEHLCVRDMYRGRVDVIGPDEFRTMWVVLSHFLYLIILNPGCYCFAGSSSLVIIAREPSSPDEPAARVSHNLRTAGTAQSDDFLSSLAAVVRSGFCLRKLCFL